MNLIILKEYGIKWIYFRIKYAIKLLTLKKIPVTENIFEKNATIETIDIFSIQQKPIEDFLKKLNDSQKFKVISEADAILQGKIKAFSSIELDYGKPINWHLNPITNLETESEKKWFNIPDFDSKRGDIKVIWEPSRFTHLYSLVRAYIITKDIKYYKGFSEQIDDWVKKNKYSYGVNYKDGQEASIRMINILVAFTIFENYSLITRKDRENIKKIVEGSFNKILANFEYAYKSIKNNHTISELVGMIIGSLASKDKLLEKKAFELLNEVINEQFLEDGGYIQKSFNYQRFALQMLEVALKLEKLSDYSITEKNKEKIKNSINQLYQLQTSDGLLPNYGHNDGALIFPLTICDYSDYRPTLNSLHMLLTGNRLYRSGVYDEEMIWFNGDAHNASIVEKDRINQSFDDSGLYIIRNKNTFIFIILQDFLTRPAHMDQLHMDLWHRGINVFCDQGTFSYSSELGKKNILNSSHNTAQIEDTTQMNLRGPFFIYQWTEKISAEVVGNHFIGEYKTFNQYTHKRSIQLDNSVIKIVDSFTEKDPNLKKIHFHTPCNILQKNNKIKLFYDKKLIAEITTNNDYEITKTYQSKYYMKKKEINKITIKANTDIINTDIELF